MKITYLDEPTYLPEKAIEQFKTMGEFVAFYDRPSKEQAIQRLNDTDIAILEWTAIDHEMFEQLKRVRYIVVALTGYSFVDVKAAKGCKIAVSNVPDYSRQSVAEHAFALLLAVNRKILPSDQEAKMGKRDFFTPFLGKELYGKTIGILGLGSIGSWVAKIGQGFDMKVIGTSRTPKNIPGVEQVDLKDLLSRSDALIVCPDRNSSTEGLLSRENLGLMKKTAVLVSIVSGICDEDALADLVNAGNLAGVGMDVPSQNSPLAKCNNTVLTTHIGWYTQDSLDRLMSILIESVKRFIEGNPQNVVNP
jgi:glycerate dehydrogenase